MCVALQVSRQRIPSFTKIDRTGAAYRGISGTLNSDKRHRLIYERRCAFIFDWYCATLLWRNSCPERLQRYHLDLMAEYADYDYRWNYLHPCACANAYFHLTDDEVKNIHILQFEPLQVFHWLHAGRLMWIIWNLPCFYLRWDEKYYFNVSFKSVWIFL